MFLSNVEGEIETISSDYLNILPSIEEELENLKISESLWIIHVPPFGGKLDLSHNGPNIGSGAVRNIIEKIQPIITLHGHVHESPIYQVIG